MIEFKMRLKFDCPFCNKRSYLSYNKLQELKWYHYTFCPHCKTEFPTNKIDKFISKVERGDKD